jgi:accessory colonization factor AcfC
MRKISFLILSSMVLMVVASCSKEVVVTDVPACISTSIQALMRDSMPLIDTVKEYKHLNRRVYVFIPSSRVADVPYIMKDEQCHQVCEWGSWNGTTCDKDSIIHLYNTTRVVWAR